MILLKTCSLPMYCLLVGFIHRKMRTFKIITMSFVRFFDVFESNERSISRRDSLWHAYAGDNFTMNKQSISTLLLQELFFFCCFWSFQEAFVNLFRRAIRSITIIKYDRNAMKRTKTQGYLYHKSISNIITIDTSIVLF